MSHFTKPAAGSWTEHYPELGTEPVDYTDSIDPDFYEDERNAIFKKTWLNIGRVERLPKVGSYFTRELPSVGTSLIIAKGNDQVVRAFHNICRHRGNKLVWDDFPNEETSGTCRQFTCKYHAWRYSLEGEVNFVQQEKEFFDLDKQLYGLKTVRCDVWAGFIFVNLDATPRQTLREFLGPMITDLDGYPFDKMTEWYEFNADNQSNWKLFADAFQEYYHVPGLHSQQVPSAVRTPGKG
ncbi:aromatic ring-hydroxylating dioxygenase subunit alpha, partial [Nocardia sp. NPDC060220]|uniref:aromatic ring-hydroxylating oxygenase subunit alpha n=1 Tax=Nocardia sp. NPDC060220 TaxID=3347076 RepID=UPI00366909CA